MPDELVQKILSRLPSSAKAYSAKLVCKAARSWFGSSHRLIAASDPQLPLWVLKKMHDRADPSDSRLMTARAAVGDLEAVKWLRQLQPPYSYDVRTCKATARAGHLDVWQFLSQQHPPWPWNTAAAAYQMMSAQRQLRQDALQ